MKKKGFTLVELLAVLVILSVIAAILVPAIGNIIDKARKSALEKTANGLLDAANVYYGKHVYDIADMVEFKIINGDQISVEKLEYNGKVDTAYVMLFKGNEKAICVDDGKYAAYKGVNDEKVIVDEGICTGEFDPATSSYMVSGTSGGSFMDLSVKSYRDASQLPDRCNENEIAVITDTKITGFYVSNTAPETPTNGLVWVSENSKSPYYLESKEVKVGISYVMQYEVDNWVLKEAYACNDGWKSLYYLAVSGSDIDLEHSNLGDFEPIKNYDYTGNYETYTAPFSGYYQVELWGAQGGNGSSGAGGNGAYTSGEIYLKAGETLYVYVGGTTTGTSGGWNGGGNGYTGNGRGGGGATDIRTVHTSAANVWNEYDSLKSRIMVAAGGGGSAYYQGYSISPGAGGGINGINSSSSYGSAVNAVGATQSTPGYAATNFGSFVGGFGKGGNAGSNSLSEGGGGAGWYGGGGSDAIAGGAGGSSYISGHEGCSSISEESTDGSNIHTGNPFSYTGYYFINTQMIDGQGYAWTTKRESLVTNQPNYTNTGVQTGNSGNGHAKISIKSIEIVDKEKVKNNLKKEQTNIFYYSGKNYIEGNYQEFIAPANGTYQIDAYGAQGGGYSSGAGGLGAHTKGQIYLTKGTKLYIYVGGTTNTATGGYNGGGNGYNGSFYGRGGGGATDIRLTKANSWSNFDSLKSRIMVAAGGGGGAFYNNGSNLYSVGGNGGALNGASSGASNYGSREDATGGTQSIGGYSTVNMNNYVGGFGYGAASGNNSNGQGGAGSGYYGGGGGYNIAGGAGGSSYISGYEGCSSIDLTLSTIASNIIHNGNPYHGSGYYFDDMLMEAGKNGGNGYAQIVLVSEDNIVDKNDDVIYNYMFAGNKPLDGEYQVFIAPSDGTYDVDLYGAQGGGYSSGAGGFGAHTKGQIYLTAGTKLYIYVGGTTNLANGGWNGGGNGNNGSYYGRGGGGATDIRLVQDDWNDFNSLKSRIMVAAGGGGGALYNNGQTLYAAGGAGGGLNGASSGASNYGSREDAVGGGQSRPGYSSVNMNNYVGGFGYGAASGNNSNGQGGAGSGYYGGGGGYNIAGGAGGSSYISGHQGCSSVDINASKNNEMIIHNGNPYHESGYYFDGTLMEAGKNSGFGRATIHKISNDNLTNKQMNVIYTYDYSAQKLLTGRYQEFVAPKTGTYSFELWGASGGGYSSGAAGLGGYTYGEMHLEKGTKLYVYVGGTTNLANGGWNGGGNGYNGSYYGRGGGGATDIRTIKVTDYDKWNTIDSLKSRIMVAAGGAGGSFYNTGQTLYAAGGAGGGLNGYGTGNSNYGSRVNATGGTQIAPGYSSANANNYVGGFGYGAASGNSGNGQGGGGSGWYGGGGGYNIAGGGGGSSYISGHEGCIAVTSSGSPKAQTYSELSDSISYTNYKFVNTYMVDGQGYKWTTSRGSSLFYMPNHEGTGQMTGNSGAGYAKITYLNNN